MLYEVITGMESLLKGPVDFHIVDKMGGLVGGHFGHGFALGQFVPDENQPLNTHIEGYTGGGANILGKLWPEKDRNNFV